MKSTRVNQLARAFIFILLSNFIFLSFNSGVASADDALETELRALLHDLQRSPFRGTIDFVFSENENATQYAKILDMQTRWQSVLANQTMTDDQWIDNNLYLNTLLQFRQQYEYRFKLWSRPKLYIPTIAFFESHAESIEEGLRLADDALLLSADTLVCTRPKDIKAMLKKTSKLISFFETSQDVYTWNEAQQNHLATYLESLSNYLLHTKTLERSVAECKALVKYERYAQTLRNEHGLDMSPDDIINLGKRELLETHRRMIVLANLIEPGKSWQDVNDLIKNDTVEDLVEYYSQFSKEAAQFSYDENLVYHYPEVDNFTVQWGSSRGAMQFPFGFYNRPQRAGGEGVFVVVPAPKTWDAAKKLGRSRDSCYSFLQLVAPHEGIPGHHYQFSVALMQPLSDVRRSYYTPVYSEGWGLYCERLMNEHDFFDLRGQFCYLRMRAWRCARAIVDPSLHLGRMSSKEAVQFLQDSVGFSKSTAQAEVNRFVNTPTQPMSYLVGCLKIVELRESYKKLKKDDFDLREFHDRFLKFGSIPINLIRTVMLEERTP